MPSNVFLSDKKLRLGIKAAAAYTDKNKYPYCLVWNVTSLFGVAM